MAKRDLSAQFGAATLESAIVYGDDLLAECVKRKIDPAAALKDIEDFPALGKLDMIEFTVGWFTGVADALDVSVGDLWNHVAPHIKPARKRRAA